MTMHQGMDLSRFKKIASDGKTSTLRHSKGHEVKIAHAGLTDKMREHIKSMPVHLAETGEVQAMDETDQEPEVQDIAPQEQPAAAAEPLAPEGSPPEQAQVPTPGPAAIPPKPIHNEDDAVSPENTVVVTGQRPQKTTAQVAQEMNAHDLAFQQDLAKGYIKPKTYQDLYAKNSDGTERGTLAKIGTIFGLLIGGAGAGLEHQPSALLGMMDKEIERDLDAQKQSNSNTQNWYKLAQQHELQKYQQEQMQTETEGMRVGNYGKALEADLQSERIKGATKGKADMRASDAMRNSILNAKAETQAGNGMYISAGQHLQDMVNKLPPGPTKVQAQAELSGKIIPGLEAKVVSRNQNAAAKIELIKNLGSKNSPQKQTEHQAINYDRLNNDIQDSIQKEAIGLTPKLSKDDRANLQTEASALEKDHKTMERYNHAFTVLWRAKDKGALNEDLYNAETAILGPESARATAGRFNEKESSKQTSGMFPTWKDFISGAAKEKYNNSMSSFKDREATYTTLNRYKKYKNPPPNLPDPFGKEQKKESGNQQQIKVVNGVKYKRGPNGEAIKVD